MIGKIIKYLIYVLLLAFFFYVSFSLHSNISYVLSVEPESRKASRASSNQPEPSVYDAYRQLLTKSKPGTRGNHYPLPAFYNPWHFEQKMTSGRTRINKILKRGKDWCHKNFVLISLCWTYIFLTGILIFSRVNIKFEFVIKIYNKWRKIKSVKSVAVLIPWKSMTLNDVVP